MYTFHLIKYVHLWNAATAIWVVLPFAIIVIFRKICLEEIQFSEANVEKAEPR